MVFLATDFFILFPHDLYSKWGTRCFHAAVQRSQYYSTAAQNPILLADHSSALACRRHNISALQLISVHSRILTVVPLFLCCIHRASWLVKQSQSSSSQQTLLSISPLLTPHTHSLQIKHYFDIWNLKVHAFISMWKTDYNFFVFPWTFSS